MSVRPSVRLSVHPSVSPSVTHELKPCKSAVFDQSYYQYERERILCRVSGLVSCSQAYNGKLVYVIESGNEDSCFKVDTYFGILRVQRPVDREVREKYVIAVSACDLGSPDQVGEWRPTYKSYMVDCLLDDAFKFCDAGIKIKLTLHNGENATMKSTLRVLDHSPLCLLVRSHRSLIRLLRTVRAIRCAHSFARSIAHSGPHGKETTMS